MQLSNLILKLILNRRSLRIDILFLAFVSLFKSSGFQVPVRDSKYHSLRVSNSVEIPVEERLINRTQYKLDEA